jgi:hypothetical protein
MVERSVPFPPFDPFRWSAPRAERPLEKGPESPSPQARWLWAIGDPIRFHRFVGLKEHPGCVLAVRPGTNGSSRPLD